MVDPCTINVLSFCTGTGMLDAGLALALGGKARAVCYVEREAFCAALLAARMEEQAVDAAPLWSDVHTFDGKPWRGVVDFITGGYPCQPFSFAGQRRGENDPRHLWPSIARVIGEVEPFGCWFENVGGHLSLGFEQVRADLQGLGYRVAAGLFTAEEVGAPHRRERLFILALADPRYRPHSKRAREARRKIIERAPIRRVNRGAGPDLADPSHDHGRGGERGAEAGVGPRRVGRGRSASGGAGIPPGVGQADAGSQRPQGIGAARAAARPVGRGGGAEVAMAHTNIEHDSGRGLAGGVGAGGEAAARGWQGVAGGVDDVLAGVGKGYGPFPPGPGDLITWRRILADRPELAPAVEPRVRGVADGVAGRLDRLRVCGNGVVPLVAAYAFVSLFACLREE